MLKIVDGSILYLVSMKELNSIPEEERRFLDELKDTVYVHGTNGITYTPYGFRDPLNHPLRYRFLLLKLQE